METLQIQGIAGDPIWVMCDGTEPYVIGVRLDCGDAGVVYLSREQATELAKQLNASVVELAKLESTGPNKDSEVSLAPEGCSIIDNEVLADLYIKASGKTIHASDCATSVAPAETPGPCDCC